MNAMTLILFLACLILVIGGLAAITLNLNEFENKLDVFCNLLKERYNTEMQVSRMVKEQKAKDRQNTRKPK